MVCIYNQSLLHVIARTNIDEASYLSAGKLKLVYMLIR